MRRPSLLTFLLWTVFVLSPSTAFSPSSTRKRIQQQRQSQAIRAPFLTSSTPSRNRNPVAVKNAQNDNNSNGPDPSLLIRTKSDTVQQAAFVGAFLFLAVGTHLCIDLWHGPGVSLLGPDYYETIRGTIFPLVFGSIFALVGILHFVFVDNFARIVPPVGTWGGLWQAPAPFREALGIGSCEAYHSYWTGVAECIGGVWLLAGGLGLTDTTVPANLLFLLTIGVTPANLYMFTHDADPGGSVPRLQYPFGHLARFVVQCGLLSNFWIMGHPAFG